jgi:hypothetical protein
MQVLTFELQSEAEAYAGRLIERGHDAVVSLHEPWVVTDLGRIKRYPRRMEKSNFQYEEANGEGIR